MRSVREFFDRWAMTSRFLNADRLREYLRDKMDDTAAGSSSSPPLVANHYTVRLPRASSPEIRQLDQSALQSMLAEHAATRGYQVRGELLVELLWDDALTHPVIESAFTLLDGTILSAQGRLERINSTSGEMMDSCQIPGVVVFRRSASGRFAWASNSSNLDERLVDVPGEEVSAVHARLRWTGTHHVFVDESTNGSLINDKRIRQAQCEVHYGDTIGIGKETFQLLRLTPLEADLVMETEGFGHTCYPITTERHYRLGRTPGCDIAAPPIMLNVSRTHAVIVGEERGFVLYDLKSANGTCVSRHGDEVAVPAEGLLLEPDDLVSLGQLMHLRYKLRGS